MSVKEGSSWPASRPTSSGGTGKGERQVSNRAIKAVSVGGEEGVADTRSKGRRRDKILV